MNNANTCFRIIAWILFSVSMLSFSACSTSQRGLFAKKTPHEQYAERITTAGLSATALGNLWFAAADKALARPLAVTLPYSESGYFAVEKPDAAGVTFSARRGDQVNIQVSAKPAGSFKLFADLWKPATGNSKPSLIATADSTHWTIQHEVEADGSFLLRLQPELLRGGEYFVTITTAPSLAFPVSGSNSNSRIGSFWGDNRGGGSRSHEGIDIFGKFRTPVVASADGSVTSTRENNLGGKVVFLRPSGKSYSLYYAHLDSQLVSQGQQVKKGDTLGLMGNTGNAKNTPTHLHFGIYTGSGAIDPLPFVNRNRPEPVVVSAPGKYINSFVRGTGGSLLYASPSKTGRTGEKLPSNQLMYVMAATANWYKVSLPDSREGFVESKAVTDQPYKKQVLKSDTRLLDAPFAEAAAKRKMPAGSAIQILGTANAWQFIQHQEQQGWIQL